MFGFKGFSLESLSLVKQEQEWNVNSLRKLITEARTRRELELLRKPPPLGGEVRGSVRGRGSGTGGGGRAIPHGMRVPHPILTCCPTWSGATSQRGGSRDRSRGCLRANLTPVGIDIGPNVSSFNPNSNANGVPQGSRVPLGTV